MQFDGQKFSDGTVLSWNIARGRPNLYVATGLVYFVPLKKSHWDAVFSNTDITIILDRGALSPKNAVIKAPCTVRKITTTMTKFYGTRLTATDYAQLEKELDMYKTMSELKRHVKTYGACKGDHTFFEGLRRANFLNPFSSVYKVDWGS